MITIATASEDARFYDLYTRHGAALRRFLAHMVGDSEAEDLAQETFIKAYRHLASLPEDANSSAWLFRIAHNTAIDCIRRRRLISWLPLGDRLFATGGGDPAETVERRDGVRAALATLTLEQRSALILREVVGLSYEEIGDSLGVSLGSVKMRLLRARESFRAAYGPAGEGA